MEYASVTTSLARDQQTYALDNLGPLKLGDRVPFLVYEQWKKLRDQLSSIVDDYVDACDALAGVASLANQPAIESIFANIDRELNHLALEEIKLASGRRTLTMFRNMSSALCSINLLPDDVLTYILELSIFSYVQDDPLGRKQFLTCPGVFASVCTRWRHIAINACCLWTHIDLIPTSDPSHKLYRRARIWLRRVKSAPLHVYIHQHDACVKREQIMQLTGFLAPLMKQLQTLHLSADCHTTDLFEEILGCWIEFGHPGSTKYLTLRRPNPTFLMAHPGLGARDQLSLGHLETRNSRQHLNKFLLPLRSLRLHNVYMGWGSAAHRGLSELHLEAIPDWAGLTICGLIAVIRGSPELSSLKISRVNLVDKDMEHEGASEPIELNNLECLDLLGANPMVVKRLLPLIIPGTTPLSRTRLGQPPFSEAPPICGPWLYGTITSLGVVSTTHHLKKKPLYAPLSSILFTLSGVG
ncbi:hypothetical protein OPQ81_009280 [Rhizoctonia solani]|nr:hypothetical protein OPQ81_009280 [Rhizoctonia solani]